MVKLGLRRPSTFRRASDESSMSIGASGHSDCTDVDFPSIVKEAGSAHSRSSGRSSIVSIMSVDTVKASGSNMRKSFKASRKSSFLSKSFRKSFRKSTKGGGEKKETSFRLEEVSGGGGKSNQTHYVAARSGTRRRTSAAPTVATMGTAGSVAAAAAAVRLHDSGELGEDGEEFAVNLTPKQMSSARGGRRASAVRGRRTTLGSIPDGIDLIEDPDGDDDRTVGDRSNCSDLSGLTGLVSNQQGGGGDADFDGNASLSSIPSVKHSNSHGGGGKRGSVRLEISRPAAQGRRRSSLCRIPDGITLVHMSAAAAELEEEAGFDMSADFEASLESLGNNGSLENLSGGSNNGSLESLGKSVGRLTIEEGNKEDSSSDSSSEQTTKADEVAIEGPSPTEERAAAVAAASESETVEAEPTAASPSPVVSSLLSMDHRLHAKRASERRALFEGGGDNGDPRLAPPAFPKLAEFVASLSSSGNGPSAPVVVDPFASSGPRPPPPPSSREEEDGRVRPVRSSQSALDELLKPSRPPREAAPTKAKKSATEEYKERSWSRSAALDCIQGGPSSPRSTSSALDRLLGDTKKKGTGGGGGPSALDRLLAPPEPGAPRPWELKRERPQAAAASGSSSSVIDDILRGRRPVVAAAAGAGAGQEDDGSAVLARHTSSAIDRILSAKPNANGRTAYHHRSVPTHTPTATGLAALGIDIGGVSNSAPRSPRRLSGARSKKARCA